MKLPLPRLRFRLEAIGNSRACLAITIGIDHLTHQPIGLRIIEQCAHGFEQALLICSDQLCTTQLHRLGSLSRLTGNEHGLAKLEIRFWHTAAFGERLRLL